MGIEVVNTECDGFHHGITLLVPKREIGCDPRPTQAFAKTSRCPLLRSVSAIDRELIQIRKASFSALPGITQLPCSAVEVWRRTYGTTSATESQGELT